MKHLRITMTPREKLFGFLYFVFHLWGLPEILVFLNRRLPEPLPSAIVNITYFSINFAVVITLFRSFLKKSCQDLRKNIWHILWTAVLGFSLYWMLTKVVTVGIFMVDPDFYNVNDSSISQSAQGYWVVMSIGTVLLVPLVEECMYRGLVFGMLANRSKFQAYLISVFIFSLVHVIDYIGLYSPQTLILCFLQYIPSALCLAWAYSYADNIFAPILMHATVNAIGMLSMR